MGRGSCQRRIRKLVDVAEKMRRSMMYGTRLLTMSMVPALLCTAIAYSGGAVRADDSGTADFPAAAQQATGMPGDGASGTGAIIDQTGDAIQTTITVQPHFSSVGMPPVTGDQLPDKVDLSKYDPPVGSQGNVGSCASWATGYYLAGWWANESGYLPAAGADGLTGFAPMFLYSQISDNKSQGQDKGSSLDDNMSILQQQGIDAESDYAQGTQDFTDLPTASESANGSQYKIASYQIVLRDQLDRAHMSVEEYIRTYMANGSPVVIALNVDTPFQNDGRAGSYYFDSLSTEGAAGHAMFASAYDDKGLWVENSWGTGWGHNGYAELSWNLVNTSVLEVGSLLPGTAGRNAIPAPAGASIALAARNGSQEDAFFVGNDGTVFTTYEDNDGAWSAPIALTAAGAAPAGAPVAVAVRNAHQEDLFFVGTNSKLYTLYEVEGGAWSAPLALTTASSVGSSAARLGESGGVRITVSIATPGAHIAAAVRNDRQEDIFFISRDGALITLFEANDGPWSAPITVTAASAAPAGAPVAAAVRNDHQEDVFYAGGVGALYTVFEANDGAWSSPIQLTPTTGAPISSTFRSLTGENTLRTTIGIVPPGASIAAVVRNDHQEDVFFAGTTGKLNTIYEDNDGAWSAPIALTSDHFMPDGGNITAVARNDHQEDVFFVGGDGALYTAFEAQDGPWSNPVAISQAGLAPAGAALGAATRNDHQEDVFLATSAGAVATADEVHDGVWVLIAPLLGFS